MNLKKIGIVLFLIIFFVLGMHEVYAQTTNSGFVPESIWYSKDPFEDGDKIKIYTLIFNPDKRELSGTVVFHDKDILLGKKDFVVPPQTAKDIYISWTATSGTHNIVAKIENAKFLVSKGKYENANLGEQETQKSVRTVKKKTDLETSPTENKTTNSNTENENIDDSESIKNIGRTIEEHTPNFILKPVIKISETIEDLRTKTGSNLRNYKKETKTEIEALKSKEESSPDQQKNLFLKPFKYVKLFFLAIFSFIFNNKVIFYIVSVALIFYIMRYIYRRIFW